MPLKNQLPTMSCLNYTLSTKKFQKTFQTKLISTHISTRALITEHLKKVIRLFFRLERNNNWFFSIKKFTESAEKFPLSEIVNSHHSEVFKICKNRSSTSFVVNLNAFTITDTILRRSTEIRLLNNTSFPNFETSLVPSYISLVDDNFCKD